MKPMTARGLRRISDKKLAALAGLLSISGHSSALQGVLHFIGEFDYKKGCGCCRCTARTAGVRTAMLPTYPMAVVREMTRRLAIPKVYYQQYPGRARKVKAR